MDNQKRDWERLNPYYDKVIKRQICQKNGGNVAKTKKIIPKKVKTILDVGAGRHEEDERFVADVDLGTNMEDFHWLKYKDNSFDLIFSHHTLEHSPMPFFALNEWKRVTKEYLLITVPELSDDEEWNKYLAHYRGHFSVFTKDAWRNLFKVAGLTIVREISADWWMHFGIPKPQTVFLLTKKPKLITEEDKIGTEIK